MADLNHIHKYNKKVQQCLIFHGHLKMDPLCHYNFRPNPSKPFVISCYLKIEEYLYPVKQHLLLIAFSTVVVTAAATTPLFWAETNKQTKQQQ